MSMLDGWNFNWFREALRQRAITLRIDPRVHVRFDESDLVQETLLRAASPNVAPCHGKTDQERLAWLYAIQGNVLLDKYDEQFAKKRDVKRETGAEALLQALSESSVDIMAQFADARQLPVEEAAEREEIEILNDLLGRLPPEQKEVLELRREGATLQDIANQLDETVSAVANRMAQATKALAKLRKQLRGTDGRER